MLKLISLLVLLPSILAFNYTIGVGKDEVTGLPGIGFDPTRTVTAANATVVFSFLQGVHQVVQTTFESPCSPGLPGGTYFDTGLVTVANGTLDRGPAFPFFPVDSAKTVYWFYDGGNDACLQGAVFCINSNETSSQTCSGFRNAALALGAAQGVASSIRSNAPFSTTTPPSIATATATSSNTTTSGTNGTITNTASGNSASNTSKPSSATNMKVIFSGSSRLGLGLIGVLVVTLL